MHRTTAWVLAAMVALAGAPAAMGQTWASLGPAPLSGFGGATGRVSAVACSPIDANRIYVAGADGGVWRTDDGGVTWRPLTDHLPTTAIGALEIDPSNPHVIYAGTGEANFANHSRYGLGLYKSTDSGETWTHLAQGRFAGRCFSRIEIDPRNPRVVYASITRAGGFPEMAAAKGHPDRAGPLGVFKSEDGGETWTHLNNGLPDLSATDLAMDRQSPGVLYAAIGHIFGDARNGVYKTTDGGATWAKLAGGLPTATVGRVNLAVAPTNGQRAYAIFVNPASSTGGGASTLGTFRTDDGGQTWTSIPAGSFQSSYGWYLSVVSVSPTNPDVVVVGGLDMRRSTNAGASWQTITPPHVDLHAAEWDASGRLIAGDDGGFHRSVNLGTNWTGHNSGLGLVQFYAGLSTHPTDDLFVIGGTQDNGTNRRTTPTQTWQSVAGGDGGWTQVNQATPNIVFAESQGTGALLRSTNGGANFSGASSGIVGTDRNCFLPPYLIDPNNPNRALYATHRIYQSTNGGTAWSPLSGDLTAGGAAAIRALAIAPSDSRRVYAATNDGRVLTSFDSGQTFTVIRTGNPGWPRVTREIFVDPTDASRMFLAVASFDTVQILRTPDAGQTWEPMDLGLENIPVNVVAVDVRGSVDVIYAGTDAGMFRSVNDGVSWARFGAGLPRTPVIDIILDHGRNRILAGTQGRGAWSITVPACYADCDDSTGPGVLDIFDFLCFQNAFASADPFADCDVSTGRGVFDIFDFLCFQNAFATGCP